MKTDNDTCISAIPTFYGGVQLKSRMEAQCAVLFDKLGWKWEYEKHSIILPSGTTFIPDFWFGQLGLLIECRGYESKRGKRQLAELGELMTREPFVDLSLDDQAVSFITIGPEDSQVFSSRGVNSFVVSLLQRTGEWTYYNHPGAAIVASFAIGVSDGKILVNCQPLDEAKVFHQICDMAIPMRRSFAVYLEDMVRAMRAIQAPEAK